MVSGLLGVLYSRWAYRVPEEACVLSESERNGFTFPVCCMQTEGLQQDPEALSLCFPTWKMGIIDLPCEMTRRWTKSVNGGFSCLFQVYGLAELDWIYVSLGNTFICPSDWNFYQSQLTFSSIVTGKKCCSCFLCQKNPGNMFFACENTSTASLDRKHKVDPWNTKER